MIFLLTIALMSLVEYVGDASFKTFARSSSYEYLLYGIVAYAIMVKLLITALRAGNLIYTNGMWDGISAIIGTLLAYFLLKETLSNGFQWAGLGLVIAGICFLNVGKIPW